MKKAILYYRVSTERQGQSGLGLDAQKKSVHDFVASNNIQLLNEYVEIESGRNNKRPVLLKALDECKKEKAILLIAKLDRLGRNVAFISRLMESNVDFIAVDNPYASKLVVHIMAAFAEYERDQISTRTREALQAAKRRGTVLGRNGEHLAQQNKESSEHFAKKMQPIIETLQYEGYQTLRALTTALNKRRIETFSGEGKWHVNTVYRLTKKISHLNQAKL